MTEKRACGDFECNNSDLLPGHHKGKAAKHLSGSRNIPLTRTHNSHIPCCKQNDRYFVSTFVILYFITRLAEMSAALAVSAFSFMATM